jgi:predicted nuclease of restriction endonuclease-like (RecB) superfamily
MKTKLPLSREYAEFVSELKTRIQSARISAARSVNRDLILLYWDIGRGILERQEKLGWGQSVVEMLAHDLQKAFPGISGFSARNLWDMRRFYAVYSDPQILRQAVAEFEKIDRLNDLPQPLAEIDTVAAQPAPAGFLRQVVAEIPWGHHLQILNKVETPAARLFYLRATAKLGWSRNVLLNQIKAKAYERSLAEGKTHNFPTVLPEYLAEQAEEALNPIPTIKDRRSRVSPTQKIPLMSYRETSPCVNNLPFRPGALLSRRKGYLFAALMSE